MVFVAGGLSRPPAASARKSEDKVGGFSGFRFQTFLQVGKFWGRTNGSPSWPLYNSTITAPPNPILLVKAPILLAPETSQTFSNRG